MSEVELILVGNTSFIRFEPNTLHNISNTIQISLTTNESPSIDFYYESPATKKCSLTNRHDIVEKIDHHRCRSVQECQDKYDAMINVMKRKM